MPPVVSSSSHFRALCPHLGVIDDVFDSLFNAAHGDAISLHGRVSDASCEPTSRLEEKNDDYEKDIYRGGNAAGSDIRGDERGAGH
jgi:hypothetical protein